MSGMDLNGGAGTEAAANVGDTLPGGYPKPTFAYVPGMTARHPEGWFDGLKESVTDDIPVNELHRTMAWQAGRAYFDAGYFWECHEVLEAVWMSTPEGSQERDMTQALIQLANARLKLLMKKPRAAVRLCDMVEAHLGRCPGNRPVLGLTVAEMRLLVNRTRKKIGST